MEMQRTFLFLGSGTSVGVPMIGCDCAVCTGGHPRNQRTRSSVMIQVPQGNLLIDTTPELRMQFLRERIPIAHALLYTHYHADHLFGLDDVRTFPKRLNGPLPIYCTDEVETVIRNTFSYAFTEHARTLPPGVLPKLEFRRITTEPFQVLGQTITPIPLKHYRFNVLGFRIGDVAYCTDVNVIPDTSWPLLEGLQVLVLDTLKPGGSHPSHFGLDESLQIIERLQPKKTYLTHMSHEMDYETLRATLPTYVEPAYDGLRFDF